MISLLAGCSAVPELRQTAAERASSVVYAVTEPAAPESVPRPPPRPRLILASVADPVDTLAVAEQYLGYTEADNRQQLRAFLGVDPRSTEWCAAFVNSVLEDTGQPGSSTVSEHPLLARSFLAWGEPVDHKQEDPRPGDVVIFPRGRQSWQGHVGFYVDSIEVDGKLYWQILGGNQKNSVSIELYNPDRALAVRRAPEPQQQALTIIDIIRSWFA